MCALMTSTACGSGSDGGSSGSSSAPAGDGTSKSSITSSDASAVPPELLGTYHFRLTAADIPKDAAPALSNGVGGWTLTVAQSGGTNEGPSFTISNDQYGELEDPDFTVEGDRILLHHEECENSDPKGPLYTYVESSYRWQVDGSTLTFTDPAGTCPDKVVETLLTTRPLTCG
jgi:hypothetical protein